MKYSFFYNLITLFISSSYYSLQSKLFVLLMIWIIKYKIISFFKDLTTVDITNEIMTEFISKKNFCFTANKYYEIFDPLISLE